MSIVRAEFAGNSSFHVDNVGRVAVSHASEHPLPTLQLVHLKQRPEPTKEHVWKMLPNRLPHQCQVQLFSNADDRRPVGNFSRVNEVLSNLPFCCFVVILPLPFEFGFGSFDHAGEFCFLLVLTVNLRQMRRLVQDVAVQPILKCLDFLQTREGPEECDFQQL